MYLDRKRIAGRVQKVERRAVGKQQAQLVNEDRIDADNAAHIVIRLADGNTVNVHFPDDKQIMRIAVVIVIVNEKAFAAADVIVDLIFRMQMRRNHIGIAILF